MFDQSETTLQSTVPQSGRTTTMLIYCVKAVLEGQPKCVVIAVNLADAARLQEEFTRLLDRQSNLDYIASKFKVVCEGSEIRFISVEDYFNEMKMVGYKGWGEFWDHAAEDKALQMSLEASSPINSPIVQTSQQPL